MRSRRLPIVLLAAVLAVAIAGTAYAFDCIRVSSSHQGLVNSTKSGNWLLFDFSPSGVEQTLATIEVEATPEQAACLADAYAQTGQPVYFALGIGVAGGKNAENDKSQGARAGMKGVIAWHNDGPAIQDGKGIDHLEESPILGAIIGSAIDCGIDVGAPE